MFILVVEGVVREMWGQVDISNGNLMSPSQVDDHLLEFHQVSGCARWCRVLDALVNVDLQTTTSVVSCAAVNSVPTHRVEPGDLRVWVLLAESCFQHQHRINCVVLQDVCKLIEFAAKESQFHCGAQNCWRVGQGVTLDCVCGADGCLVVLE